MNVKDISISNNRKKQIIAAIKDESVLIQEENGDLVIDTQAYRQLKEAKGTAPVEDILDMEELETVADYVVFQ